MKESIAIVLLMLWSFAFGAFTHEKDMERQLRETGKTGWFVTITCNK